MSPSAMVRSRSGLWVPGRNFPVVPTSAAGRIISGIQANTTAAVVSPDLSGLTKVKGDLLMALFCRYGAAQTNAWGTVPAGWTQFCNLGSSGISIIGGATKVSDGTETGTITWTQQGVVGGHAEVILMSIPGGSRLTLPETTSLATGTTSAGNPAALTPSWGSAKNLWIAVLVNGETASAAQVVIAANSQPTNYSGQYTVGPSAAATTGEIDSGVAFRQLEASSEDVGSWTTDITSARNAQCLIALRPA